MVRPSLSQLIQQTILWEMELRDLYTGFAQAFAAHTSVHDFWKQMAIDESSHAALLRTSLASAPADVLTERLDEQLEDRAITLADSVERLMATARTAPLRTLNDAYEVAHLLESSELNTLFSLLMSTPLERESKDALLTAQFKEHIARLTRFGRENNRQTRESILAQVDGQ